MVGISQFPPAHPPLPHRADNGDLMLETSVTWVGQLGGREEKALTMSAHHAQLSTAMQSGTFSADVVRAALDDYNKKKKKKKKKRPIWTVSTRGLMMRFSFPVKVESLRSGLQGYQYYDIAMEVVDRAGRAADLHASGLCLFLDLPLFAFGTERNNARGQRGGNWPRHIRNALSRGCRCRCCPGNKLWFGRPDRPVSRRRAHGNPSHGQARG